MTKRDYYEILGIDKTSSKAEIKKAYRNLAKKYHPDRNKEPDAEEKFKEVQEAYEILTDDGKRSAYDQYGHAGTDGFSGFNSGGFSDFGDFSGFGGMNDIFEQFFGSGFGGFSTGGSRGNGAVRGADIESGIKISFEEAVFGTSKKVRYKRKDLCDKCEGNGAKNGTAIKTCETCGGRGQVITVQNTFLGKIQTTAVCPTCHGSGKEIKEKCEKCDGQGRIERSEDFEMKIPPGIPDGVTLRFKDRGNAGQRGGNFGDLFVSIEVTPHDRLERRGDDIYMDEEIDVITAVLGGEITVPTVHGDEVIKIPNGSEHDKIIKLTGKGGPKFRGNGNGDQYVRLKIKIPKKLSKEQKDLWKKLAETKSQEPGFFEKIFS